MKSLARILSTAVAGSVLALAAAPAQAWTPPTGEIVNPATYALSGTVTYEFEEAHPFGFEVSTGPDIVCDANGSVRLWAGSSNWTQFTGLTVGGTCAAPTLDCDVSALTSGSWWDGEGNPGTETIPFDFGPNMQFQFVSDGPGGCSADSVTVTTGEIENVCAPEYLDGSGVMTFYVATSTCMIVTDSTNNGVVAEGFDVSIDAPALTLSHGTYPSPTYD